MTSKDSYQRLPPGFRFHPTDEELVNYYLRKKVALEKFELDVIAEIDLNKLEPWDLQERCKTDSTQTEWFFFSYNGKKYPTGTRTNRATTAGFWKATGRDKPVYSNSNQIGMRKTLVFYTGRAPHGQKTDWIMHEYRMDENEAAARGNESWVICRVFGKRNHQHKNHSNTTEKEEKGSRQKLQTGATCVGQSASCQQLINCKQELEIEDSVLTQETFLQLPELESPKISFKGTCSYSPVDLKKNLSENCRRTQLYSLEPTSGMEYSKSFLSECGYMEYADNRHIAEWNFMDNSISKEVRLLTRNSFAAENACALQGQGLQHAEYAGPANYEMDLWNFER